MSESSHNQGATADVAPLAFCMRLRAGCAAEYQRRHDEIWPEIVDTLHNAGVYDYSIFLNEEDCVLFAVLRLRSDHAREGLAVNPVMRRWWAYMADLMRVQADGRPIEHSLKLVFRLP